jgi:putative ABC transport system substrate-binding protein
MSGVDGQADVAGRLRLSPFDPKAARDSLDLCCKRAYSRFEIVWAKSAVKRREFITLAGAAAATWPSAARAQQSGRLRRIGVLMADFDSQPRIKAFESAWPALGWVEGRNVHVDYHFAAGDPDSFRTHAAALVAAAPEVILVAGTSVLAAARQATQSIPIVFVGISDPEGAGVVDNLSRPGGTLTGFANFEPTIGGKWLQTLKEVAPQVTRVAVLRNPDGLKRIMTAIESLAPAFSVEALEYNARNADEIARVLGSVAGRPNTGLIMMPDPVLTSSGRLVIDWAATNRVPALYPFRSLVAVGGLMCYGVDIADQVRRAAFYIDRILKGEKPADMPVQAPTKFELVINLRTAKVLDLKVPPTLLTSADELIE